MSERPAIQNGEYCTQERQAGSYPTTKSLLALLGVFLLTTVLCALLLPFLEKYAKLTHGLAIFITYVVQFGVTIFYGLFQQRSYTGTFKGLLRFSLRKASPSVTLWGVLVVVSTGVVIEPLLNLFPESYFDELSSLMGIGGWMMLTAIVAAPILEEVLFRGILQESLTRRLGAFRGILLSSALFGVIHINPPQVVNAFFVALVLGYIYYKTQSLVPVIFIHAVNNALSYFSWMISDGTFSTLRQMVANDKLYYVLYGVALTLFLLACVEMFRMLRTKKELTALKD